MYFVVNKRRLVWILRGVIVDKGKNEIDMSYSTAVLWQIVAKMNRLLEFVKNDEFRLVWILGKL